MSCFFFFSVLMLIPHRLPFSALFEFSDDVTHYALIQQEIARHLYPTTLRALYGKTKVRNAVHCTDLPEDGVLEVGTVPHSESKRIVFSDVLLGTPTLLRVCMCLLQLHNTFPPDCLSAYARVRCSSLAQEQNPSQLCEAGSHDSAPWAGATLDHTGFQGNKNGRGIWNKPIVLQREWSDPSSVIVQENSWSAARDKCLLVNHLPVTDWTPISPGPRQCVFMEVLRRGLHYFVVMSHFYLFIYLFFYFLRWSTSSRFWMDECEGNFTHTSYSENFHSRLNSLFIVSAWCRLKWQEQTPDKCFDLRHWIKHSHTNYTLYITGYCIASQFSNLLTSDFGFWIYMLHFGEKNVQLHKYKILPPWKWLKHSTCCITLRDGTSKDRRRSTELPLFPWRLDPQSSTLGFKNEQMLSALKHKCYQTKTYG